ESPDGVTLSDFVEMVDDLSALKSEFAAWLDSNIFTLDYSDRAVLQGYPGIRDYLIAYAYRVMNRTEVNGLTDFILNNKNGAQKIATYATISSARAIIHRDQLKVDQYDTDNSDIVRKISTAGLPLSSTLFETKLSALIKDYQFNSRWLALINGAGVGPIPDEL